MADPLGLAAGVIGIAATGFAVAQGLYQIADGIGSAGQEVRIYADEIDAFSKLLKMVRAELLRPSSIFLDEQSLVRDVMDICDRVLQPLNRLQNTLRPLLVRFRSCPGKLRQFGLRVQWYFSCKDKLLFYREALRSQHRILDTTLELMILQANRDKSAQNVYILQVSLENSMNAVSRSLSVSTGVFHQKLNYSPPPLDDLFLSYRGSITTDVESELPEQQSRAEAAQQPSQDEEANIEQNVTQTAIIAPLLKLGDSADGLSQEEVQAMNEQIERDLDPDLQVSARELWEDMRSLSRKVLRFASAVLRSSQEDSTTPVGATTTSTRAPLNTTAAPSFAPGEFSDSTTLQTRNKKLPDPITLEDADGVLWELPYDQVRSWKDMTVLLNEIYPKSPYHGIASNRAIDIMHGQFRIMGSGGQMLLPSLWERAIKPGWKVTFRFLDPALNKVKQKRETLRIPVEEQHFNYYGKDRQVRD